MNPPIDRNDAVLAALDHPQTIGGSVGKIVFAGELDNVVVPEVCGLAVESVRHRLLDSSIDRRANEANEEARQSNHVSCVSVTGACCGAETLVLDNLIPDMNVAKRGVQIL